jgi:hypothetical protein
MYLGMLKPNIQISLSNIRSSWSGGYQNACPSHGLPYMFVSMFSNVVLNNRVHRSAKLAVVALHKLPKIVACCTVAHAYKFV